MLFGSEPRNYNSAWMTGDTEEMYLNQDRDALKTHGWDNKAKAYSLNYTTNEYGFREERDYRLQGDMALGCSFTYGMGVHKEDTWPSMLGGLTDRHIYNFGMPGHGLMGAFRIAMHFALLLKPKNVYILAPGFDRIEYFYPHDSTWAPHGGWSDPSDEVAMTMLSQENAFLLNSTALCGIKGICDSIGANMYMIHPAIGMQGGHAIGVMGRDLVHPGRLVQKEYAKLFVSADPWTFTHQNIGAAFTLPDPTHSPVLFPE